MHHHSLIQVRCDEHGAESLLPARLVQGFAVGLKTNTHYKKARAEDTEVIGP